MDVLVRRGLRDGDFDFAAALTAHWEWFDEYGTRQDWRRGDLGPGYRG